MILTNTAEVKHGLGQHYNTIPPAEFHAMLKPFWTSIWLYYLTLTFTKISILLQYSRLIVYRKTRVAIWIMMGIVVAYGIGTVFDSIFLCTPVRGFWNRKAPGVKCVDELRVWYANAVINIIMDVAIVVLPMPALHSLSISKGRKLAVMALFALGLLYVIPSPRALPFANKFHSVTITSVIRLYSIHEVANSEDVTWDNVGAAVWSCVESNVGIICACLPASRPLYSILVGRRRPVTSSHYRIPEDGLEMPLTSGSASNSGTNKTAVRDSANAQHLGDELRQGNGKSTFLVSSTQSDNSQHS